MTHNKLPFVFLDVSVDGDPAERMIFELFDDVVPKTAKNFRALCTGENGIGSITGKPMHYKGSIFHRIVKGFFAQGGDFSHRDGSGGESIYGEKFEDESFSLKHDGPGYLSMFNSGPNSNGSQFLITFKAAHHLDGLNVVFGKLVKGRGTLKKMERAGTEEGKPEFLVKIVNSGEVLEGRRKKSKRSSKGRKRKKRRRYSSSESESSSDTDTDSSDSDSESDSDSSSSSDISSSSDDRRKKRKRSSYKKDKHKRSKRRRDKRREKKRKRRDKKSRRKSKRAQESSSDTESGSTSGSRSDYDQMGAPALPQPPPVLKSKHSSQASEENQSPLVIGKHAPAALSKNGAASDVVEQNRDLPRENGNLRSNGVETETPRSNKSTERKPDLVDDDLPRKSRSPSTSPKKAMSISPPPRRHGPRSLTPRSLSRSPDRVPQQSRSISRSPERAKSITSRSSRSRSRSRSIASRSPSPGRGPSRVSRSPVKAVSRRSGSRSSLRSARRRSPISRSPSPVKRKRSVSRSPVRKSLRRRSVTRSPVRRRRSYSRSPISPPTVRKGRSPLPISRGRSVSRSVSPDGSPKRVRRGRGFSYRYSYARRYRTPTPDRSLRYGGRTDRSYRSYADRSSRHYRSPPRGRTPPSRYKSRRSWSRSRSAPRSPIRSRRSPVEKSRSRGSLKSEKRGRSVSSSRSRSPVSDVKSLSPRSQSPKPTTKEVSSRSVSASPVGKGGLVSYTDGSPDSGH